MKFRARARQAPKNAYKECKNSERGGSPSGEFNEKIGPFLGQIRAKAQPARQRPSPRRRARLPSAARPGARTPTRHRRTDGILILFVMNQQTQKIPK